MATIVVVEDDPDIADLLDLYLRRDGHRVYLAADGAAGLELIGVHHPDVVILDVGLPGHGRPRGVPAPPLVGSVGRHHLPDRPGR